MTVKTSAIFFPFDLFGSAGTGAGAQLLADGVREMLADNRREREATRARAYQEHVRIRELHFERFDAYRDWRHQGRRTVRRALADGDRLLWLAGNHLGVLPVYEELGGAETLVVQFDAHLDIYHLSDCTAELSHGNFLLHSSEPLPRLVNVGHRELLLPPEHIGKFYQHTFPAVQVACDRDRVCTQLRKLAQGAERVLLDLDCDALDAAFFPAVPQAVPFGLTPQDLLRCIDAVWSEKVIGLAVSEFDPARDQHDRSLGLLLWLIEHVLLRWYEEA